MISYFCLFVWGVILWCPTRSCQNVCLILPIFIVILKIICVKRLRVYRSVGMGFTSKIFRV